MRKLLVHEFVTLDGIMQAPGGPDEDCDGEIDEEEPTCDGGLITDSLDPIDAARAIALRLYRKLRSAHDWGARFDDTPSEAVLERLAATAPREMRRAWMTAFGNARLAGRATVEVADLPGSGGKRQPMGFVQ